MSQAVSAAKAAQGGLPLDTIIAGDCVAGPRELRVDDDGQAGAERVALAEFRLDSGIAFVERVDDSTEATSLGTCTLITSRRHVEENRNQQAKPKKQSGMDSAFLTLAAVNTAVKLLQFLP